MKGLISVSYRDKNTCTSVSLVLATKIHDIISVKSFGYHLPLLIGHVINSDR